MTFAPSTERKRYLKLTNRLLNKLSVHPARHMELHSVTKYCDTVWWCGRQVVHHGRCDQCTWDQGWSENHCYWLPPFCVYSAFHVGVTPCPPQENNGNYAHRPLSKCAAWKCLINSFLRKMLPTWYHVGSVEPFILRLQCHKNQFKHLSNKNKSFMWKKWKSGLRKNVKLFSRTVKHCHIAVPVGRWQTVLQADQSSESTPRMVAFP